MTRLATLDVLFQATGMPALKQAFAAVQNSRQTLRRGAGQISDHSCLSIC
jgi:hypothetical protein